MVKAPTAMVPVTPGDTFTSRTVGVMLGNLGFIRPGWMAEDYAAAPLSLPDAMFLAHEATHVWQWQNRGRTGYHPLLAATEHLGSDDPYLFEPDAAVRFLDQPYEVQASLVEEWLCCVAVDPAGARTGRLTALLRQELPLTLPPPDARLPWPVPDDLAGACS